MRKQNYDLARWRWVRALGPVLFAEFAIWWMLVALVLVALGHSRTVKLAFWLDVLTTLPACLIVTQSVWLYRNTPPPPRGWLIACVVVESIASLTTLVEIFVRASWLQCKGEQSVQCKSYPEANLATVGLVLIVFLFVAHVLAVSFASVTLSRLSHEAVGAARRDTASRDVETGQRSHKKRGKAKSRPAASTESDVTPIDPLD